MKPEEAIEKLENAMLLIIDNGKDWMDERDLPVLKMAIDALKKQIPEFFEMVDEFEKKLEYAKKNTSLPKDPDYKKINEFVSEVNLEIVKNG